MGFTYKVRASSPSGGETCWKASPTLHTPTAVFSENSAESEGWGPSGWGSCLPSQRRWARKRDSRLRKRGSDESGKWEVVPAVCELFICSKLVKTFLSNKTSLPLPSSNTISQTPLGYRDAFLVSLGKKGHGLQSEAFPSRSRPSQGLTGHPHLLDVGAWPGRARGRAAAGNLELGHQLLLHPSASHP